MFGDEVPRGKSSKGLIRISSSLDSLGNIDAVEYEDGLYDALVEKYPGAEIDIYEGLTNTYYGEYKGREVPSEEIKQVSEEVFNALCRGEENGW